MANYYKSFNFKNGLQVDNDNFIINENGLVGIGTSVPTELLDVRGNVKVTGIATVNNIYANAASFNRVNVGITSISSGIITATSGIITYYGDGSKLSNMPGSTWQLSGSDTYTTSNVGISTTNPNFKFQVGPNPLEYDDGLGIDSKGNVYTNGIVTAFSFSGNGGDIDSINASKISSGTLLNSRLPSNISVSGIITATSFSGSGVSLTSLNASNISSGTLSNSRIPSNINVSGIITASSFVGNLTGTATTATNLVSTGSITLGEVISGMASVGVATISNTLYVSGFPGKIGVGTISAPQSDIEVRKSGIASIRSISDNNIALIGVGRSAEIRTGNTDTYYSFSTKNSLDIINTNSGNVNTYIDYGSAGLGTGGFHWIYGQDPSDPLMSLTYTGNLGIGITDPPTTLYVSGDSHFDGPSTIDNSLNVSNDLTVSNNVEISGNLTVNGSINGNISKLIESQNTSTITNNTLIINASQGNVFTHTTTGNIGIVSFTGISTSSSSVQKFTVLINQGVIPYNISTSIGIGTQLATIVTSNGVGYSTHINVPGGVPLTLTNRAKSLDLLTFIVSYNGTQPITSNSFTIVGTATTDLKRA